MTATTLHTGHAAAPRGGSRSKLVLGVLTMLLALWLGLTAPSISPVAPPLPAVVQAAALVDQTATPDTATPAAPVPVPAPLPVGQGGGGTGGGGRGGGGRR